MRKTLILNLILLFAITSLASAGIYTFNPSGIIRDQNGNILDNEGSDLDDLDHNYAYKWGIDISAIPTNEVVIGATLFFDNIKNWNSDPNDLYVNAIPVSATGVSATDDNEGGGNMYATDGDLLFRWEDINTTVRDIAVTLTKTAYKSELQTMLADNKPSNYQVNGNDIEYWSNYTVYDENGANTENAANPSDRTLWDGVSGGNIYVQTNALDSLLNYVQGNILGLGFDPDCHYYNDGVSLTLWTKTSPDLPGVPEPASMLLFGTGLLFFASRLRKQNQKTV